MEGGFDPLVMLKKSIDGAVLGEVLVFFFFLFLTALFGGGIFFFIGGGIGGVREALNRP
jgi:hypothetical protein